MAIEFLSWALILVVKYGYAGLLVMNFVAASTIILPTPSFVLVASAATMLDPFWVAFSSAVGAALGELVTYGLAHAGRTLIDEKNKWLERSKKWMHHYAMFFLLIFFAATPMPDDILGLICGASRYDIKKFLVAVFIGKFILMLALAYSGHYGISWVYNWLAPRLSL